MLPALIHLLIVALVLGLISIADLLFVVVESPIGNSAVSTGHYCQSDLEKDSKVWSPYL